MHPHSADKQISGYKPADSKQQRISREKVTSGSKDQSVRQVGNLLMVLSPSRSAFPRFSDRKIGSPTRTPKRAPSFYLIEEEQY
jgi:hypothetical protein